MNGFEYGDPGSSPNTGGFEFGDPGSMSTGNLGSDYMDFGSGDVPYNPTYDYGANSGASGFDLSSILKTLGGGVKDVGGLLKTFLNPKGDLGGLPLLALAALGNRSGFFNAPTTRVGFQGTIPKYTFERQQVPFAQQRPSGYRPGQGGITYFAPSRYLPAVATAPAPAPAPNQEQTETISAADGGRMVGGLEMLAKGRYLKGNGDGVSDSIPAQFAGSGQKAMLADGEFVIPARVVSEIGNGSSDAGARKLYAMLDRIEAQAKKAKRGKPSGADRELNKLA
jgi:hypothetical protein